MKTKTQIPAMFLIISIMFATNTFAIKRDIKLEEETYIDDMPFDTEKVAVSYAYNNAISVEYEMDDEANIDDIPFDTFLIAVNSKKDKTINLIASQK